jgi:hypothetical protein
MAAAWRWQRRLADIAAPVEKKLRQIAGHEFRAFGIAWTMAQNRWRDGRD